MTATDAPALSELSEDQLASLYESVSYDAEASAIVLAEMARRDRNQRAREDALQARRRDPVVAEWSDAAVAQFCQAEAVCQGNLVRRGAKIEDPFSLWSGPEWLARKQATEELNNFWDAHPRIPTVTEWREHERADIPPDITEGATMDTTGASTYGAPEATAPPQDRRARLDARVSELRAQGQQRAAQMNPHAAVAVRGQSAVVRQSGLVDGAETLEYARRFLAHFAVWPSDAALTTATLWAAHAHGRDAEANLVWLASPRLLFSSAEPGSGKSWAMKLTAKLCPSPALFTEPSEPAVAHAIGKEHATLALDEIDVLFGRGARKAAIRAVINDGYTADGVWARVRNGSVDRISTFGALMLAGLDAVETSTDGHLAALLTRCIRIRMKRAAEDYRAPRFDHQARFAANVISERLGAWCKQELPRLSTHVPDVPEGIGNRPAELWEPLLAVADIAGGDWPELAREACEEMVATGGMPPEDDEKLARLDQIMVGWDFTEEE